MEGPSKVKASTDQRNFGGKRNDGPRVRTCYNCGDKYHFVVDCNYERREDHNGKLVPKEKTKLTKKKKPFVKKRFPTKRQSKALVLTKEEEYISGEEEEDEDDDSSSEVAAIATTSTSTSSLFGSPNENLPKNINCLMARASRVLIIVILMLYFLHIYHKSHKYQVTNMH